MFPGKLIGERRSKKRGQSVEFDDYRNYVPGDDLRFIDWNVYARLDRLFIKLFLEEEDLALHVVVDGSASMRSGEPEKLLFGAKLAMALGYIGLVKQNRVGMSVFGRSGDQGLARLPDCRGRRHVPRLGQFLIDALWEGRERLESREGAPGPGGDFSEALQTIARLQVGKGILIIISDFFVSEGYEPGLRSIAAAGGYHCLAVQVLSPQELEPQRLVDSGLTGDLRLTDVETGRAAEVTVNAELLREYRARLERYTDDLHKFCSAREIDHILARSDTPLETLMLDTLRRRGVVG